MHIHTSLVTVLSLAALQTLSAAAHAASGAAASSSASQATGFKPTESCEQVEKYDPQWASYGNDYGFDRILAQQSKKPRKGKKEQQEEPQYLWGFYQLQARGDTVYATFGGAMLPKVTPGALLAIDAETLTLKKTIPLPFAPHALAISPSGTTAVTTHTVANAFSVIDLASGSVNCRKPDTMVNQQRFGGRYVAMDDAGNIYINYNRYSKDAFAKVMKYTPAGEHASGFAVPDVEQDTVISLNRVNGQLYTGRKGLKRVDQNTGQLTPIGGESPANNVYNYTAGPGKYLLAANYDVSAQGNLQLVHSESGDRHSLFTGLNTVEVAYVPETHQAFSTNYDSKTLTIAALSPDATGFGAGQFVNIQFEGHPATLTTRRSGAGTDIFVAAKHWELPANAEKGAQLHRIRIAPQVKGIDGLSAPGACTIVTLDMRTGQTTQPAACQILDPQASYRAAELALKALIQQGEAMLAPRVAALPKLRAEAHRARKKAEAEPTEANRKAAAKLADDAAGTELWNGYFQQGLDNGKRGLQTISGLIKR